MISNLDEDCWCQKSCQITLESRWKTPRSELSESVFVCSNICEIVKYEIQISDSDHSDPNISNYVQVKYQNQKRPLMAAVPHVKRTGNLGPEGVL